MSLKNKHLNVIYAMLMNSIKIFATQDFMYDVLIFLKQGLQKNKNPEVA